MAAVLMANLETGDTSEGTAAGTAAVQASVTAGVWSNYALRVNPATTGTGSLLLRGYSSTGVAANSAVNAATFFGRMKFRADLLPAANDEEILVANTTAGAAKLYLRITSGGKLAAYDATPTLIATGTKILSSGTFYRIEFQCGTGNGAAVEWKVDGTLDVSTTANLSATNYGGLRLGKATDRNGNSVDFFYDDVLVSDSDYPGDGRGVLLAPNANGTYQTGTIGAGSGSHYQIVNEVPPDDDTSYLLTSGTSGDAETEAMADLVVSQIASVNLVRAHARIKQEGAGSSTLLRVRSGSTDSDLAALTAGAAYGTCARLMSVDPATSSAWTVAGVNALEAGLVEQTASAVKTRLTFVALMVDYVPASAAAASRPRTYGSLVSSPGMKLFGSLVG